jgi:hypothetical protein
MSKAKIILAITAILSLSACSATEEFTRACGRLGITPSDAAFSQCMLQQQVLDQQRAAQFVDTLTALSVANTPSNVNVYVHQGW